MAKTLQNREKMLRISLYMAIASLILIGVGVFIALGAFTRDPYIVSEKTLYRITRDSNINLTFLLEPNEIYDTEILQPSDSIPIYLSLVRLLVVNYTYSLSQGSARGDIKISVLLVHPDGWAKRYYEAPINIGSRSASTELRLNLSSMAEFMVRLSKQVAAKQDMFTLRISVSGDTIISYQQFSRRDLLSQTVDLGVLIGYNKVEISGNQSLRSVFEEKSRSTEIARLMGMSVEAARNLSIALTSGGIALTLISVILRNTARRPEKPEEILESRYSQAIIEINGSEKSNTKYKNVIYIDKPEELIKLSRILEKPVLKECYVDEKCEYYIVDQDVAYILKPDTKGQSGAQQSSSASNEQKG